MVARTLFLFLSLSLSLSHSLFSSLLTENKAYFCLNNHFELCERTIEATASLVLLYYL